MLRSRIGKNADAEKMFSAFIAEGLIEGMARPKKPAQDKRDKMLAVYVTDMESIQIEQAASMRGMGLSEFVRRRALGMRMPAGIVDRQAQAEATTALLRLGVNLNQIAKHVNAGRAAPVAELSDIIARVNAAMDALYESGGIETR